MQPAFRHVSTSVPWKFSQFREEGRLVGSEVTGKAVGSEKTGCKEGVTEGASESGNGENEGLWEGSKSIRQYAEEAPVKESWERRETNR